MINENKRRNSSKNKRNGSNKIMHTTIPALKIAAGSCISMYIARQLQLDFAASAGTITLLTLLTTRWETLKLSCYRLLSLDVYKRQERRRICHHFTYHIIWS